MANPYFKFKQFTIFHDRCAMKVTTDACLFGAWLAAQLEIRKIGTPHSLDIGAGSGLLSLMLAQKIQTATDAVEIDREAAAQAAENIEASPWRDRVQVICADAKAFTPPVQYDLIFSNPPFYENEWPSDDEKKNKAHHSSELVLEELLVLIKKWIKPSGYFALLLPAKREKEAGLLFSKHKLHLIQKTRVRQSVSHDYFRLLLLGTMHAQETVSTDEFSICNEKGEYTSAFTALLQPYYLYL